MFGLDYFSIIYLISVCFLAAIVRGYSGFGFSALLILSTTWVLPPVMAVPIILMLEIVASLQLLPSVWAHIHWSRLFRLLAASAVSTPIGIWGLSYINESTMGLVISCLILVMSFLLLQGRSYSKYDGATLDLSTGFISGVLNGLATIGGMTIAVVFLSLQLEAVVIRSTLVALFFVTDLYAVLIAWSIGLVSFHNVMTAVFMLPSLFIGITVGSYWFKKTSGASFRQVILVLLIFLSIAGLVRYFIELL